MGIADTVRGFLPEEMTAYIARWRRQARRKRVRRLPRLSERDFLSILRERLGIETGDIVYIGSSVSDLSIDFPAVRLLPLIREAIGEKGTMLFPNYPNQRPVSSYKWLIQGNIFDIRSTPSYTGALTEMARTHPDSVRSLHPTKSVCDRANGEGTDGGTSPPRISLRHRKPIPQTHRGGRKDSRDWRMDTISIICIYSR